MLGPLALRPAGGSLDCQRRQRKGNPYKIPNPSIRRSLLSRIPILLPEPRALIDTWYYGARRSDKMGKPLALRNTPAPPVPKVKGAASFVTTDGKK